MDRYIYLYDLVGNKTGITKERRGLEAESGVYTYGYDALGRLSHIQKGGKFQTRYGYDAFGNRTLKEEGTVRTIYRYNALNQLIEENRDGIEKLYDYDRRGNLIRVTENGQATHQYVYGTLNRLEMAVDQAGKAARYTYNGLVHRVGRQEGTLTKGQMEPLNPQSRIDAEIGNLKQIRYTIDLTKQYHNLLIREEEQRVQTYFWDGNVTSYEEDGRQNYYLQDELGSPLRIEDELGVVKESYGYGAFGEDLYGNQGRVQPFGYTGYRVDDIAGTYFAQAREYRPETGRFCGQDIIKGFVIYTTSLNNYLYCWGDPVDYVDNDGKLPTIAIGALIGGVVGGVGSIISDVAKGEKIDWGKAGKNALKGGAAGALIGTGVGAVGALSSAGASSVAVHTAVAATAGASFRAGADIVTSIKNKEMTISSFNRYITSATTGAIIYTSFKIAPRAATIGAMVQVGSDLIAGEVSSLESYGSAVFSTAKDFALKVMKESAIAVVIALVAGKLGQIEYIKDVLGEDEWSAIIDGLRRKIENCID